MKESNEFIAKNIEDEMKGTFDRETGEIIPCSDR
jgi:hypothetical protein